MTTEPEGAERLREFLGRQQERESQDCDVIRQAVLSSDVPLPPELVQAIIHLPEKHFRAVLRDHPGFPLAERRSSYFTSVSIMELCVGDLLKTVSLFEKQALAEGSALFHRAGDGALFSFERRIQKELFATANSAASLVDHSRRLQKRVELPGYTDQLRVCFGTDGLHEFVIGLRVLLHHLHVVKAEWRVKTNFSKESQSASFMFSKETLLYAVAQFPETFGGRKVHPVKTYVEAARDSLDVRAIFEDYGSRIDRFHGWLREQLASAHLVALRDYDRCILERKRFDARTWWNMLLGNWLRNWRLPPNPHDHLHKYLTPEQLGEVYNLPRNSRAQVDLVIRYLDTDQAVDDGLRKLAYELFERSP